MIPKVAASEIGGAQTAVRAPRGKDREKVRRGSGSALESAAIEGESPLHEAQRMARDPEYCQTRGSWQEEGGTTHQG